MGTVQEYTCIKLRLCLLLLMLLDHAFASCPSNITAVERQLTRYKSKTKGNIEILSTSSGAPVYKEEIHAINQNLLFNQYFLDVFTRLTHERIPERLVHAKGAGAFGEFIVTKDITHICSAKLFSEVGKKTKLVCRFSTVFFERAGSDVARDTRGFACKFYTEDGNFDLLTLSSPIFSIKDPLKFIDFTRVFKRNPATNVVPDNNMIWDFVVENPEAIFSYLNIYGDGGIPDGFRSLPGHAIHAFQVVNDKGEISFVKFIWEPVMPKKNLTTEQAEYIQGKDLDYATRDLYNAIANKEFPTWTLFIQVLSLDEVKNANFDVFDVTKEWPKNVTKLEVGRMVLNRNPLNNFAEIEQLAFNPVNLVPGILGGIDSIFQIRRFAYVDTQRHRLGSNFNNIHVNCPLKAAKNYIRDGVAPVLDNGGDAPNFYTHFFNGPSVSNINKPFLYEAYVDPEPNNFDQASEFYETLPEDARQRLAKNIASAIKEINESLKQKVIELLKRVNNDLMNRVSQFLQNDC